MRNRKPVGNMLWAVLFFLAATIGFNGCGDVNNVSAPPGPARPGILTILTSDPLPDGTVQADYNVTLAPNGGTPPYTWSLAPGSPTLPDGLALIPDNGKILGVPTTATTTRLIEFKLKDSTGKSVQKVLALTVNASPTPLAILTEALPPGNLNRSYATALGGTGGTTPYKWGLKSGSPSLPPGILLDSETGAITGSPTQTSGATHIFTLQDVTSRTVEKSLTLTISAVPLSITTDSPLPQGTANQNYSAKLAAIGGTGDYKWGQAVGSPALPNGLSLNTSTGLISGIPASTSDQMLTFTVTDQTPPTPQTQTKTLQLIVGAAAPPLVPAGAPLPSGFVGSLYSTSLDATGGSGAYTWSIFSGALPNGLSLASTGAITGTPQVGSNGTTTFTVQVQDSGTPPQSAKKQLSITIGLPAAPKITTTSLPPGTFNVAYNQTVSVTGGLGTLLWGVTSGSLPPGLNLNPSNGHISGTPTSTSTSTGQFTFTLRVTDQIPQFDEQILKITIDPPAPPTITAPASLPTGTVTQPYPNTTLTASGGTAPLTWDPVVNHALPNGLSWDADTHTISGIPLDGSQGTVDHTFTVRDSTNPFLTATRKYSLTVNLPAPPSITTTSASLLPDGTVTVPYSRTLLRTGGTAPFSWSFTGTLPTGLNLNTSTGVISGTPTAKGTFKFTPQVTDSLSQTDPTPPALSIKIGLPAPPNITTTALLSGTVGETYSDTVVATGGTGALTWSVSSGSLPSNLTLDALTGVISGTPDTADVYNFTVKVTDDLQSVTQVLSITIAAPPLTIATASLPGGTVP